MKMDNFKILIVDSDKELSEILKSNLEDHFNCNVHLASTATEAIDLLNANSYDLISTEQYLPSHEKINKGNELIAQIKANNHLNSDIPVLFFTTYTEEVFGNHQLERDNTFVLNKTARLEKYLTWAKILLYSQFKKKLKKKTQRIITDVHEEVRGAISLVR